jgi:seryl-tRNA synthetase
VPDGKDETDNVEIRRWGTPRSFDFTPKSNISRSPASSPAWISRPPPSCRARVSSCCKGAVARIHRALAQFMLDLHSRQSMA